MQPGGAEDPGLKTVTLAVPADASSDTGIDA
jgi:hypothetical protein